MRASGPVSKGLLIHSLFWLCLMAFAPVALAGPTENDLPAEGEELTVEIGPEDAKALAVGQGPDFENGADPVTAPLSEIHRKVLSEVASLRARIEAKYAELAKTRTSEQLKKALNQNEIYLDEELGKAEIYTVNGTTGTRVVHRPSELAVFYLATERIARDAGHVRQIVARQHIMAGKGRKDKKRGRDVLLVWTKDGKPVETQFLPRPSKLSPRWWMEYWRAIYKKPSKGDIIMGTACGLIQAGLAGCVAGAKAVLDPAAPFEYAPAALSWLFGTVIGVWASTYRNFTLDGSPFWQTVKSSSIGALFAYSMMFATGHGHEVLNIVDTAGVLMHLHVLSNLFAKQWAKTEWHQFNRIRNEMRVNTDPIRVGEDIELSRASIEHQLIYLIPFTLTLADLTGVKVSIPSLDMVLPLGKLLLWSSIPFAQYAVYRYARSQEYSIAPELKARWERTRWLPVTLVKGAIDRMVGLFSSAGKAVTSCASRLVGRSGGQ